MGGVKYAFFGDPDVALLLRPAGDPAALRRRSPLLSRSTSPDHLDLGPVLAGADARYSTPSGARFDSLCIAPLSIRIRLSAIRRARRSRRRPSHARSRARRRRPPSGARACARTGPEARLEREEAQAECLAPDRGAGVRTDLHLGFGHVALRRLVLNRPSLRILLRVPAHTPSYPARCDPNVKPIRFPSPGSGVGGNAWKRAVGSTIRPAWPRSRGRRARPP